MYSAKCYIGNYLNYYLKLSNRDRFCISFIDLLSNFNNSFKIKY